MLSLTIFLWEIFSLNFIYPVFLIRFCIAIIFRPSYFPTDYTINQTLARNFLNSFFSLNTFLPFIFLISFWKSFSIGDSHIQINKGKASKPESQKRRLTAEGSTVPTINGKLGCQKRSSRQVRSSYSSWLLILHTFLSFEFWV